MIGKIFDPGWSLRRDILRPHRSSSRPLLENVVRLGNRAKRDPGFGEREVLAALAA